MIATFATWVVLPLLMVAIALAFVRLARGPSAPDRVVALDLMSTIGVGIMGAYALITRSSVYVDVALVVSLISFLGTVALAIFIERGR